MMSSSTADWENFSKGKNDQRYLSILYIDKFIPWKFMLIKSFFGMPKKTTELALPVTNVLKNPLQNFELSLLMLSSPNPLKCSNSLLFSEIIF